MSKGNFYSDFNSKFYIKIYGNSHGNSYNQLASIPLLRDILGKVLCDKVLGQAYYSDLEKITFKFRRGLKVTFYAK